MSLISENLPLAVLVALMLFPRSRDAISAVFGHLGTGIQSAAKAVGVAAVNAGHSALKAVGLVHSSTPPPGAPKS